MVATKVVERDYLKDLIRTAMTAPILDQDQELEYIHLWKEKKCEKSLAKLTDAHMRMAVSTAIKYRGYGLPLGDLVQEGLVGMLEAAKRFDVGYDVRFCTYAGWWIRAEIQDYVLRNWSIVRIGSKSAHKKIFFNLGRVRAMIDETHAAGSRNFSHIAQQFKVTEEDISFMAFRMSAKDSSLNATISDETTSEHIDLIEDDRDLPDIIAEGVIDAEKREELLKDALLKLNKREYKVIQERFFNQRKVTLFDLGTTLGLSKERVRQIEKQAIVKLRHSLLEARNSSEIL